MTSCIQPTLRAATLLALAAFISGFFSGCETTEFQEGAPPPAAELGPEFDLAHAKRDSSAVAGVMDSNGRAHLIIAYPVGQRQVSLPASGAGSQDEKRSTQNGGMNQSGNLAPEVGALTQQGTVYDVRHLVVGQQGVESGELVASGLVMIEQRGERPLSPRQVDLAFDRTGQLHALVAGEHLILKNGAWVGKQRTPWQEARFTPTSAGFVKNAPDLTWYAEAYNIDLGLPDKPAGSASAGRAASTYAEYETYRKVVVTPEQTPYQNWYALTMEDDTPSVVLALVADSQGALHVYYRPGRDHARNKPELLRYAVFRTDGGCAQAPAGMWFGVQQAAPRMNNGVPVCPVIGSSIVAEPEPLATPPQTLGPRTVIGPGKAGYLKEGETALTMDPVSGAILLTGGNLYSILAGSGSPRSVLARVPAKDAGLLPAPAGNNRFHALMPSVEPFSQHPTLYYLAYRDGAWSAPVAAGNFSYSYFGDTNPRRIRQDTFRIINDGRGRALLVWPYDDALRARWVNLK